ncbi:regulatory protein TetR [Gordonia bronchialis DSM 43247]|uniref:Regulatory protein TetR n=1 Tax=Gordonia bronchialis (strain ATCC 25592 / DSM 43247 / BCRC 13721 / JCM 3198 / KCTC 3076 / NBRC 16047 / NCTC 10667) TaxID=526226 RepID=D0LAN9_GORB4|nr:TetR/AcrR family transcriptional regulator [Gordonia bronchialis]ACY21352.1 regulatory protein TetR [Gordonia bronchialis DSM 43247]MCC3324135.1 TetR/AcrR family transcriptional regulator [Gordonia bronchialis]STQ64226.1 Potential acrAB operon repressor [Gordonia bronchialis]
MTRSRPATRLGVQDWLDAGLRLLVEEGVDALKVARLSSVLGVTKGSFYWHFADIAAMKSALAQQCAGAHEAFVARLDGLTTLPPGDRLDAMRTMLADPHRWRVESALRRWADVDPILAGSVALLDQRILDVSADALRDIGFSAADAQARASVLLYTGIGCLQAHDRVGAGAIDECIQLVIDLVTRLEVDPI